MGEWKWTYSAAKNFGGYKEYRAWFGYDRQDYATYCRCWWSIGAEMKYGYEYGVRCSLSGGATASSAGVLKSDPGKTWTTVTGTRKDGYVDVTRGHTATTLSFTSKAYGSTVDGYGGAGSGSTSVTYTYTIPARASYTVYFNANGGSGAPTAQTKWYDETLTLSSTKPSKTGYTFLGWATSSSATSINYSAGDPYRANSGTTLYAVWKKTLTLSYNANGGSGAPSTQTKDVYNSTTSYSFTIPSTVPTLDRYVFKGWGTSASSATASYQPGSSVTISSNTTLYAVWELGYISPVINSLYSVRTLQDGTEDDDGTYARVSFDWSIDTEHDVTLQSITVEAKEKDGASWVILQTVTPSTTSGTFDQILTYPSTGFNTEKSYDLRITVEDDIGNSVATSFISQAFFLLDVNADGTGLSIGAPADDGVKRFRCAIDAQFDGNIIAGGHSGFSPDYVALQNTGTVNIPNQSNVILPFGTIVSRTDSGGFTLNSDYTITCNRSGAVEVSGSYYYTSSAGVLVYLRIMKNGNQAIGAAERCQSSSDYVSLPASIISVQAGDKLAPYGYAVGGTAVFANGGATYCQLSLKYVESVTFKKEVTQTFDIDSVYPVGAIYLSATAVEPSTLFGGTWEPISQGRFLIGANPLGNGGYSGGSTGGQASVSYTPAGTVGNHTLTTNEIPAHHHQMHYSASSGSLTGGYQWNSSGKGAWSSATESSSGMKGAGGGQPHNHGFTGTAATIATMPPYLAVYMWQRIA